MKKLFFILLMISSFNCFSQNEEIEQKIVLADKYLGEGKYDLAIQIYKETADQGHPGALFVLGSMYYVGENVNRNVNQAYTYFKKLSDLGYFTGSRMLASLYIEEKEDYTNAKKYLELAIEQGDEFVSCYMLGQFYSLGHGVPIDKEMSIKLYKKAALNGEINSMYSLGCLYNEQNNNDEALKWWKKAAEEGDIDVLYKDIWNSADKMYAMEQRINSLYNIGYVYYIEYEDYMESVKWLEKAAKQGHIKAQFVLGATYYDDLKNMDEAIKWTKMAADNNFVEAQYNLGLMYEDIGKKKEAIQYYKMAADQGYKDAISALKEILR